MLTPARQNDSVFYLGATLAGVGVWATLLVLYGLLVYRPMVAIDRQNREDAQHLAQLLAASGEGYDNHRKLRQELDDLNARIAATVARVPDAPQESEFIAQVSAVAEREGVSVTDYRPGTAEKLATHSQLSIDISCTADYPALCRFLHAIETLPRQARITRLQIESQSEGEPHRVELACLLYFGITAEHNVARNPLHGLLRSEGLR